MSIVVEKIALVTNARQRGPKHLERKSLFRGVPGVSKTGA